MESKKAIWEWKGIDFNNKPKSQDTQFPITKFIREYGRKTDESVLGPGYGVGIGCGVGLGLGLVGGAGYGGWPWNHLNLAFGLGFGCGVGFGIGFGQGVGYGNGFTARVSDRKSKSGNGKRIVIEI